MNDPKKSLTLLLVCVALLYGAALALNWNRPYWGDEQHFLETVRLFGRDGSLATLAHYPEMSTPLPFILYALWGQLVSFATPALRVFSLLIALITFAACHALLFSVHKDARLALVLTALIALNPYMLAFGIFVFTDMLAILCLILFCIAVRRGKPILLALSSAGALLARQYLIFLVLAAVAYYLLQVQGAPRARAMLTALVLSLVPLLLLFVLWRGPSPDSPLRALYLKQGLYLHVNSITLYTVQFFVYLLPVVLVWARSLYADGKRLLVSFALSGLYLWFPIAPGAPQVEASLSTLGLFHRLLRTLVGVGMESIVFYLLFFLGCVLVLAVAEDALGRWRRKEYTFPLFLDLAILVFPLTMSFSYLGWEKYFLPVLPLMTLWLTLPARPAPVLSPGPAVAVSPK